MIAKSDAMTDAELAAYRQQVNQMLQHPDKVLPDHGLTEFSLSTFPIEAGVSKLLGLAALPLAVNCSRHKEACSDEELLALVGPHGLYRQVQPVRQYAWGAVYPLARECQSDLLPLKRLLLGDQVSVLHALLDDSYKRYIEFCEVCVLGCWGPQGGGRGGGACRLVGWMVLEGDLGVLWAASSCRQDVESGRLKSLGRQAGRQAVPDAVVFSCCAGAGVCVAAPAGVCGLW